LGIDLFKSVLMYSNGAICLIKLLFKMGLFTVLTAQEAASKESARKFGFWTISERSALRAI
jgi:hypothetical protein